MPVFKLKPNFIPSLNSARGRIVIDDGREYTYTCHKNLNFDISYNGKPLITGQRLSRHEIRLIGPEESMGSIYVRQARYGNFTFNGTEYRIPNFLKPNLEELGFKFSRWTLNKLEVNNDSHEKIALALLVYIHAWNTFDGGSYINGLEIMKFSIRPIKCALLLIFASFLFAMILMPCANAMALSLAIVSMGLSLFPSKDYPKARLITARVVIITLGIAMLLMIIA